MDELEVVKHLYGSSPPPSPGVIERNRETLMNAMETSTAAPKSGSRTHRRRLLALIAIPAAVAVAAAGWAVLSEEATEAATLACVADDVVAALPNDGTPPVDACRTAWERGAMVQGTTSAPRLVACVSSRGRIEVVEADDRGCAARGMADWREQSEYIAAGQAVRSARESLHDRYKSTKNGCATVDDWRSRLGDILAAGWQVEVLQVEASRRCYDVGRLDPIKRTVVVVGAPGDYSIGCDPRIGC